MQRLIILFLPIFLIAMVLSCGIGCGETNKAGEKKTILTLVVPYSKKAEPIYQEELDNFMLKNPTVTVELKMIPGNYYQKVLIMMAARMDIDLVWMGMGFSEFAERGAFLDITEQVKHGINTEDFFPKCLDWYKYDGRNIGIPFSIDMEFIVYNKELFDKAGLPYPSNDWSFDDFLKTALKLTIVKDNVIKCYGYKGNLLPEMFGASFISSDGAKSQCNTPEMIDYLKTTLSLYYKYKISPSPEDQKKSDAGVYSIFRRQQVAMLQMYTWNLPHLSRKFKGMNWGIVLPPEIRKKAVWASSKAILISKDTKHPELSWRLCKRFMGKEFQKAMAYAGVPANKKAAAEIVANNNSFSKIYKTLFAASNYWTPVPRVSHQDELYSLFNSARQSVWSRRLSPEKAMKRADREINRALKKFKRGK